MYSCTFGGGGGGGGGVEAVCTLLCEHARFYVEDIYIFYASYQFSFIHQKNDTTQ